jgi:hypothetical protein
VAAAEQDKAQYQQTTVGAVRADCVGVPLKLVAAQEERLRAEVAHLRDECARISAEAQAQAQAQAQSLAQAYAPPGDAGANSPHADLEMHVQRLRAERTQAIDLIRGCHYVQDDPVPSTGSAAAV